MKQSSANSNKHKQCYGLNPSSKLALLRDMYRNIEAYHNNEMFCYLDEKNLVLYIGHCVDSGYLYLDGEDWFKLYLTKDGYILEDWKGRNRLYKCSIDIFETMYKYFIEDEYESYWEDYFKNC